MDQCDPVGEASRLEAYRGKMPFPHGHHDRNRDVVLTMALSSKLACFLWERLSSRDDRG
jgi:hypothetical protein